MDLPRQPEDLAGQRFGALSVVSFYASSPSRWNCECDCGQWVVIRADNLKGGRSQSCGCQKRGFTRVERSIKRLDYYPGVMVLIARDLGPSAALQCVRCGRRASQWLSDGTCEERRRTLIDRTVYDWCKHPEHYVPVCHRCSSHFVETFAPWESIDTSKYEGMPKVPAKTERNYENFVFPVLTNLDKALHQPTLRPGARLKWEPPRREV